MFFVCKSKLNIGNRAFLDVAPTMCNQLPIAIKSSETVDTFRKKLKTYLFEIAFPPSKFGVPMLVTTFVSPRVCLAK